VKLAYNSTSTIEVGQSILRRVLHVGLGTFAAGCLMLALSPAKKESTSLEDFSEIKISSKSGERIALPASTTEVNTASTPTSEITSKEPGAETVLGTGPTSQSSIASESQTKMASLEPKEEWQSVKIRNGDTLSKIFHRLGVSTKELKTIISADKTSAQHLTTLQPGKTLKLKLDEEGTQVDGLALHVSPEKMLSISRTENGFEVIQKELPVEKRIAFKKAEIHDSLILSAKRAGIEHKVISQIIDIFGSKIDFSLDLRPRDHFRLVY